MRDGSAVEVDPDAHQLREERTRCAAARRRIRIGREGEVTRVPHQPCTLQRQARAARKRATEWRHGVHSRVVVREEDLLREEGAWLRVAEQRNVHATFQRASGESNAGQISGDEARRRRIAFEEVDHAARVDAADD
eukprot:3516410-Prymnesium_polylepis.1